MEKFIILQLKKINQKLKIYDCQSTLVKREDDTEEIFESRYQVYLDETKPLIDFYAKENVLYRIDGNLDKMSIFNEICSVIEGKNDNN